MYVMGFVQAVPTANKKAYEDFANQAVPFFRKFGAVRQVETWGADVPTGEKTDFYRAVAAKPEETIVYSFQTYPDKATADEANRKMMDDPDMAAMGDMPFDGARMIYGGFAPISEAEGSGKTGYVEGSLMAVPESARDDYTAYAEKIAKFVIDKGAVRSVDAWGEFLPDGKQTDFRKAVAAEKDESVVFGWIEWPSKEVRDKAWADLMGDADFMQAAEGGFDEKRRVFGGFVPILDA